MSEMNLSRTTSIQSIAVIGAGISGLCAARTLTKSGMLVTIFEKARGVGGRTSTRREPDFTFDHGAQFFTVADDRFRLLVQEWESAGCVAQWNVPIVALNKGTSRPAGDTRQRYVGVPGMNAMARHLAEEMHVVLNKRIARCERRGTLWHLFDEGDALSGAFDAVIVTTPPEQAIPLLAYSPSLIAAVGTVTLSPCWVLMVAFDRRLDIPFDGAYVENSSLSWIARNGSKPGRSGHECWVIHASREWSHVYLEREPKDVAEQLIHAFFEEAGLPVIEPVFVRAHRWRYALADEPRNDGFLWDEQTNMGVCGDWCLAARIEGAARSGVAIAERVLGSSIRRPFT